MTDGRQVAYRQPFYRRHPLRFECTACGACCRGGGDLHVFLAEEEARRICAHLALGWRWFRRRYLARHPEGDLILRMQESGDCVFLDDAGRCRVYSVRPVQCATYPFWREVVSTTKGWRREARRCEGIGRGAVIPLAVIEARLALSDSQQ
ncbi:MAG TPA: YkgJ family cysteine cluster protein [Gammaproteobacteria bacterium]|nr:YkgJ family cysteine cluster protein [Gammaproteobacteria bacterium]